MGNILLLAFSSSTLSYIWVTLGVSPIVFLSTLAISEQLIAIERMRLSSKLDTWIVIAELRL